MGYVDPDGHVSRPSDPSPSPPKTKKPPVAKPAWMKSSHWKKPPTTPMSVEHIKKNGAAGYDSVGLGGVSFAIPFFDEARKQAHSGKGGKELDELTVRYNLLIQRTTSIYARLHEPGSQFLSAADRAYLIAEYKAGVILEAKINAYMNDDPNNPEFEHIYDVYADDEAYQRELAALGQQHAAYYKSYLEEQNRFRELYGEELPGDYRDVYKNFPTLSQLGDEAP